MKAINMFKTEEILKKMALKLESHHRRSTIGHKYPPRPEGLG